MFHYIVAAKLRVFFTDCMKAMGTGRDNDFGLDSIQGDNILVGHLGKEIFIAGAPSGVARALFTLS
jgi:hypothetical protein